MSAVPPITSRGELERMVAKALYKWKAGLTNEHIVASTIQLAIEREVLVAKGELIDQMIKVIYQVAQLTLNGAFELDKAAIDAMIRAGMQELAKGLPK